MDDPTFRGTVLAILFTIVFCSLGLSLAHFVG